jgi:hypothetical protein
VRHLVLNAEAVRFAIRTMVCSEQQIHQRRDIGVIAEIAIAVVVPMVQLGRPD